MVNHVSYVSIIHSREVVGKLPGIKQLTTHTFRYFSAIRKDGTGTTTEDISNLR